MDEKQVIGERKVEIASENEISTEDDTREVSNRSSR